MPNHFWSILLTIGGAYGVLLLLLFFGQSRLLYLPNLPSREHIATPTQAGLPFESVKIETDDGIKLDGWFVPATPSRGVLLFFHGNAGNISHRLQSLKIFHDLGLSTLIIDYRGYGRSEGAPSEQGTYLDAEAAWRYLTQQRDIPPQNIVLFGRSLGAAVASYLATQHTPGALIVESGFTSVPSLAADLYPFLPARWLSRFHYDTETYLQNIKCPVLIVHSREDEIIPFEHGRRLYRSAREPKQFLELQGGHNDGFLVNEQDYVNGLDAFLTAHFGR